MTKIATHRKAMPPRRSAITTIDGKVAGAEQNPHLEVNKPKPEGKKAAKPAVAGDADKKKAK